MMICLDHQLFFCSLGLYHILWKSPHRLCWTSVAKRKILFLYLHSKERDTYFLHLPLKGRDVQIVSCFYASFHTSKKRHFLLIIEPSHMEARRTLFIVSLFVSDLTRVWICPHILVKASNITFNENPSFGIRVVLCGRIWTDGDTLLNT
jgi:hypothetical protein